MSLIPLSWCLAMKHPREVNPMTGSLCPAQQKAINGFLYHLPLHHLFIVYGATGLGKTTLLQAAHERLGGTIFQMKDFIDTLRQHHPIAIEEVLEQLLMEALSRHDTVLIDDMHLLWELTHQASSPRASLLNIPFLMVSTYAAEANKKLILGTQGYTPHSLHQRACHVQIGRFQVDDYEFLCRQYLDEEAAIALDYAKIYRFASKLSAYQLKDACLWLKQAGSAPMISLTILGPSSWLAMWIWEKCKRLTSRVSKELMMLSKA